MLKKQKNKSVSMRGTMLKSTLGISIGSLVVLVIMIIAMEMIPSLKKSAYISMRTQCESRAAQLGSQLNQIAMSTWSMREQIQDGSMNILSKHSLRADELQGKHEILNEIMVNFFHYIEQFINEKAITGAFVILNAGYTANGHASLYVRDASPGVKTKNNADFMLLRGPVNLAEFHNMPLEKTWSFEHAVGNKEDENNYLFEKPYQAYQKNPKTDYRNWGYWSSLVRLKQEDIPIITYSIPLLTKEGEFFGITGFELSGQFLSTLLPQGDLPYDDSFFIYGNVIDNSIIINSVIAPEAKANIFLLSYTDLITFRSIRETDDMFAFHHEKEDMIITFSSLDLYSRNSPFNRESPNLMAIAPKAQVLSTSDDITFILIITILFAVAASIIGGLFLSKFFSSRIEKLAQEVKSLEPDKPPHLLQTNIREIDELSATLEQMSATLIKNAARMSTIVDLVGIPLGAFEVSIKTSLIFLTDSLFRLFEIPHGDRDSQYLTYAEWNKYLPNIEIIIQSNELTRVYRWASKDKKEQWMRVRHVKDNDYIYGTILDITDEIHEKERLKHERDYDPLTNLLNRNAYVLRIRELIQSHPGFCGAMLFIDLDNLKNLNDTFGHDIGDRYIQLAAQSFKEFENIGAVVARIAGDEFVIYLHGYHSKEAVKELIDEYLKRSREFNMILPNASIQKVRMSVGIAYYPHDDDSITQLIKYADFAMYEIKHSAKGGTHEFDKISYERNGFLLNKSSILDNFLDFGRMRFAFQPIIDAASGNVFGYEALMRPATHELHSPSEVIALARSQSKLYQLEKLVFNNIFKWISANAEAIGEKTIFFNSLPNQMLSHIDFEDCLGAVLQSGVNMVMEVTEEEYSSMSFLESKVKEARVLGFHIALDDYGSGYSNELSLLTIQPDYIKIDMALIQNINKDPVRQALIRNIIDFSRNNGLKVIAEGVENQSELTTLISMGVDYLQGYYLSQPQFSLMASLPERILNEIIELNEGHAKNNMYISINSMNQSN